MINPLHIPIGWPESFPDPQREARQKHPLWGWLIALFRRSRFRVLDEHVESALRARCDSLDDAWQEYPEYTTIINTLQTLLAEQLWGFAPVFVPKDSYVLLGQILTGDLCEVEMIMAIEEAFQIEIPRDMFTDDPTMLSMVKLIAERMEKDTEP